MKNIILIILMFASQTFANEDKNQTKIKVQIQEPITINTTKDIKAKFENLKDEAMSMGVNDLFLTGKINYSNQGRYNNLNINWSAIESLKGLSNSKFAKLSNNFTSKLTTDSKQILPPQSITVLIDEDVLMSAINSLNTKNKVQAQPVKLDKKTVDALTPNDSSSAGNSGSTQSLLPQNKGLVAEVEDTTTSVEEQECPVRYDVDGLRAYEQKSVNTIDSNGNTLNVGTCLDSGVTYELVKSYGTPCSPLISDDKVYQSYRVTGVVAGEDKIIRDCQVDLEQNQIAIQTTIDGCNYEHHLDLSLSYQTERKFYELDGEIINISQCETNTQPYAHVQEVCSYDLEISSGFAIPQVKTYITLDDGSESLVQDCTTFESNQLPVEERECTGESRYFHDFNASVSYLQKEKWVKNPFDNDVDTKVNDCQISATNYNHLQQASNCARTFEDHNLLTRQAVKTYINDPLQDPSEIFISECSNGYFDIPYTIGDVILSEDGETKIRNYTRGDNTNYQLVESTASKLFDEYTEDNMGIYFWEVPSEITSVFVQMQGGKGGNSGQACVKCNDSTCSRKKGGNGGIGGSVVFDTVSANGGSGGAEVHYPSDSHSFTCNPANFGSNGESKNIHKNVTPNDLITITINNGHSGASVNYLKNAGSKGSTGSVLVRY